MPPKIRSRTASKPCKDCVAEGVVTRRKTSHPGPRCQTHHRAALAARRARSREQRIEKVYGITEEEYQAIYEAQGGVCYICRRAKGTGRKRLSVDHCHETGRVRALLCLPCNRDVLGHLRDDVEALQRAIEHLQSPIAVRVIGTRVVPDHENLTMNGAA